MAGTWRNSRKASKRRCSSRKSHRSRGLYLTAASYAAGATRKLFATAIGLILPFGARSLWAISEGCQGCPRLHSDRDRQKSTTGWELPVDPAGTDPPLHASLPEARNQLQY